MRQNVTYIFNHLNDNTVLNNLIWDPVAHKTLKCTILVFL